MAGRQAQSLAYSLDDGQTWTKYAGNPVLDRGSSNFRDPKVFWYDGPGGAYWVMLAVEALDHKVVLYRSDDLIDWTHLSDFGPANATGGIWECPDLFPLPVDGDPDDVKWVMVVNLNPGSVAGGSGGQYFVGDFDGTTFTSESTVTDEPAPTGAVLEDFDDGSWDEWRSATNPATGATDRSDWRRPPAHCPARTRSPGSVAPAWSTASTTATGRSAPSPHPSSRSTRTTSTSSSAAAATPTSPAASSATSRPPVTCSSRASSTPTACPWPIGAGSSPVTSSRPAIRPPREATTTWVPSGSTPSRAARTGDDNTGTLTSPEFVIDDDHLSFLIGGGKRSDGTLQAELVVDGQVVRSASGQDSGALNWAGWDVSALQGRHGASPAGRPGRRRLGPPHLRPRRPGTRAGASAHATRRA